jgi:prevent-host-death family protein
MGSVRVAWNLAQAREYLSEIVERAHSEGPQHLAIEGREAVILSADEYRRLSGNGAVAAAPTTEGASDI